MNKKKIMEWVEKGLILIAHLLLLKWILYVLSEGGRLSLKTNLLHFTGMALFGAILIRGTSYLSMRRYKMEKQKN
ncbi:MAG: hypothetical protein KBD63_03590 [Bacteriovoracaceae bacterium]|nr:hypothetical protein [Bacteriovoracaceae bacterium]